MSNTVSNPAPAGTILKFAVTTERVEDRKEKRYGVKVAVLADVLLDRIAGSDWARTPVGAPEIQAALALRFGEETHRKFDLIGYGNNRVEYVVNDTPDNRLRARYAVVLFVDYAKPSKIPARTDDALWTFAVTSGTKDPTERIRMVVETAVEEGLAKGLRAEQARVDTAAANLLWIELRRSAVTALRNKSFGGFAPVFDYGTYDEWVKVIQDALAAFIPDVLPATIEHVRERNAAEGSPYNARVFTTVTERFLTNGAKTVRQALFSSPFYETNRAPQFTTVDFEETL